MPRCYRNDTAQSSAKASGPQIEGLRREAVRAVALFVISDRKRLGWSLSAEMLDATHAASERDFDCDPLAERFFSQPPAPWEIAREVDDWRPEPLSALQRMAMLTTVAPAMALLAVGLTFLVSHPLIAASANKAPRSRPLPALESILPESIAPRAPELPLLATPAVQPVTLALAVEPSPVKPSRAATPARRPKTSNAAKRARQLLDAGDVTGARDVAREAVRSAPGRAAGYIVLAAALDKLGDRAGRADTFRRCAERATDALAAACKGLAR